MGTSTFIWTRNDLIWFGQHANVSVVENGKIVGVVVAAMYVVTPSYKEPLRFIAILVAICFDEVTELLA